MSPKKIIFCAHQKMTPKGGDGDGGVFGWAKWNLSILTIFCFGKHPLFFLYQTFAIAKNYF